jgi:hypothetical protein
LAAFIAAIIGKSINKIMKTSRQKARINKSKGVNDIIEKR